MNPVHQTDMRRPLKQIIGNAIIGLSLASLCFQGNQNSTSWQKSLGYGSNELHPIKIGNSGVPYVSVSVNGEKLELMWDTGNMSGLVLNSEVATRLKLPVVGSTRSYDSSGVMIGTQRTFNVSELRAFGEVWTNVRTVEIKNSNFDGLIGPAFVSGKRFTLDYVNRVLAISQRPLPSQRESQGVLLPLIQSPTLPGMLLVRGSVNGREVLMQLDTGKSRTCVDPELVASDKPPQSAHGYELKIVKLGPYSFSVRSAKEVSFKGISEGLGEPILLGIGSDILSQVILTVDYSRHTVELRLNAVEPSRTQ